MKILPFRRQRVPEPPVDYEMQYRIIHGYRRAFVHVGKGPALLLIHGIGDSSETWRNLIPLLARNHTVIAPDLLGHGLSDKPRADYSVAGYANAMRDLLSVLGIEQATVLGHSLGGGVAMQFAYQYPDRCERLVLVSSGGVSRDVHPILRMASTPGAELVLPLLRLKSARMLGHGLFTLLGALGTDIGLDAADMVRVFDALPDVTARRAFVQHQTHAVQRGRVARDAAARSHQRRGSGLRAANRRGAGQQHAQRHLSRGAAPCRADTRCCQAQPVRRRRASV